MATALAACCLTGPALAQPAGLPTDPSETTAGITTGITTDPPGPAEATWAFRTASAWIRGDAAPEPPATDPAPTAHVVAIDARLDGRPIAKAVAVRLGDGDDRSILHAAAAQIWQEITASAGTIEDLLQEQELRDLRRRVSISIELGGRPIPFAPLELAAIEQATLRGTPGVGIDVGREGLVVRFGDQIVARPASALTITGADVGFALATLFAFVSPSPELAERPLDQLTATGAAFYRFRSLHLLQEGASGEFRILTRGGDIKPPIASTAELVRMAEATAAHLARRRWGGVESLGVRGTYDPVADRFPRPVEAFTAAPFEQARVASALASAASCARLPTSSRQSALAAAREVFTELAVIEPMGGTPEARVHASLVAACIALDAAHRLGVLSAGLDHAAGLVTLTPDTVDAMDPGLIAGNDPSVVPAMLERCYRKAQLAFDDAALEFAADVSPAHHGVVALGLARVAQAMAASPLRSDAERDAALRAADLAVRAAFAARGRATLPSVMPDLAWAALAVAELKGEAPGAASALRDMRRSLWEFQVTPEAAGEDRDFIGGIVFVGSPDPLPRDTTAGPVAAAASMLGDPAITPASESRDELRRLLTSLGFLRQLTADDSLAYRYPDAAFAAGGVRRSLYDQRMPNDASAMTLLAVTETLNAVDTMSARGR